MDNRTSGRTAFTLIEVLLVIVILSMLAAVAVVTLGPARDKARIDTTGIMLKKVEAAMERYNNGIGHYPTEEEGGLEALVKLPTFEDEGLTEKWVPYLKPKDLKDAWNQDMKYELTEDDSTGKTIKVVHIWSMGPDGQEATDDDIKSWSEDEG